LNVEVIESGNAERPAVRLCVWCERFSLMGKWIEGAVLV